MIKVRILKDGFCIGMTRHPKGTIINVAPIIADYLVGQKSGEIIDDTKPVATKTATKKKVNPKRRSKNNYKRRDMQAQSILD